MFPDSRPFMLSDLSLIIQTLAFLLISYAVYRKRESIVSHGKIAGVTFYLSLPAVFYMLYSRSRGITLPHYSPLLSLHMLLGILTIFTGILFVANRWKWKIKKYRTLKLSCEQKLFSSALQSICYFSGSFFPEYIRIFHYAKNIFFHISTALNITRRNRTCQFYILYYIRNLQNICFQ